MGSQLVQQRVLVRCAVSVVSAAVCLAGLTAAGGSNPPGGGLPAESSQLATTAEAAFSGSKAAVGLGATGAALDNGELMIGGGEEVNSADIDWLAHVSVTNYDNTGSICTGVLIDPSWVLTAKHCTARIPHYINVSFGVQRIGFQPVDDYKVNPDYDAVLLHLKTPVQAVAPAKLAQNKAGIGDIGVEYGWGGAGKVLQSTRQRVVASCFTVVGKDDPSKFTADCSGEDAPGQFSYKVQWPGVATEHGDSGGPLVVDGQVVGTLIGGNTQASYFGSVLPLADWLQSIAQVKLGEISMRQVEYPFESRIERIAGSDRVSTAMVLHGASGLSGDAVVLTTGFKAPDALSAAGLVGARGATILLSDSGNTGQVEPPVLSAIKSCGRKTVYLVGGGVALSPAQLQELSNAGVRVERLAGADRFATAAQVASLVQGMNLANSATPSPSADLDVFLVDATSDPNVPDAIAAGPVVAARHGVILFTRGQFIPDATRQVLRQLASTARKLGGSLHLWAVGGRAGMALGEVGSLGLGSTVASASSIAGSDRYETAVRLAETFAGDGKAFLVASGTVFADGLAGAGYAHASGKMILLTDRNRLSDSLGGFVKSHPKASYTIAGGSAAVSRFVANQIGSLLQR